MPTTVLSPLPPPPAAPPAEDAPKPLARRVIRRPTKLRPSITPGTVLILLAGRFKGKVGAQHSAGRMGGAGSPAGSSVQRGSLQLIERSSGHLRGGAPGLGQADKASRCMGPRLPVLTAAGSLH